MTPHPLESTRALLDHDAVLRHGFLDVLGERVQSPAPTAAQRAMNSSLFATVYERVWRPFAFYLASGVTAQAEGRRAKATLRLSRAERLLDVACGPGNFTGPLASALPNGGLAVGFDISAPMLIRAVRDNSGPRTCYVRGDARRLPFDDATFDAVCCFGALYLMPEPFTVAGEMIRVLRPGGRIAILTTCFGEAPAPRQIQAMVAGSVGLKMFDRRDFVELFSSAGLVDIELHAHRVLQFVTATKPD